MAVTDLTNTKWLINSYPIFENTFNYNLLFTSNNTNYSNINVRSGFNYDLYYGDTAAYLNTKDGASWTNEAYKTIEITGGADVTNANLITWLTANATQILTPKETFEKNISTLNEVLNEKAGTTGRHTVAQMVGVAESIQTGGGHTLVITSVVSSGVNRCSYVDTAGVEHNIATAGTYNNVIACYGSGNGIYFFLNYDISKTVDGLYSPAGGPAMILLDDISAKINTGGN